jgi:antitoxin FitA
MEGAVAKTVQIRDVDDEVYAALARRAADAGVSVPELLRRHATRLAARPTIDDWLARTGRRASDLTRDDVIEALDELRGPWPDAGG